MALFFRGKMDFAPNIKQGFADDEYTYKKGDERWAYYLD